MKFSMRKLMLLIVGLWILSGVGIGWALRIRNLRNAQPLDASV
jgi:hypothetical protein